MTILDDIAASSRERVASDRRRRSLASVRKEAEALAKESPDRDRLGEALRHPGLSFICEVKKASPSKGVIAKDFPYLSIAQTYERAGADAISVLTEPHWFLGSDAYVREIADAVAIPVLRKDFTVDEYQIYQAKTLGASAVLLICSILSDSALRDFRLLAEELGLSALLEAHDGAEVNRALGCGARILGVNNRDLNDFSVSLDNARSLRNAVPDDVLFVAESGIASAADVAIIAAAGADGALIGEALMRSDDIAATLASFQAAAASAPARPKTVRPKVKFCGLCQPADVAAFNELRPDYAGLVFYPPSSRVVSDGEAHALRELLDPKIVTVGVFVDEPVDHIAALAADGVISVAQLHGNEDAETIDALREQAPDLEIWKAFIVDGPETIRAANACPADKVMLDASLGGGRSFDWRWLEGMQRPYILAGGLSPENVAEALDGHHPEIIDVSSGIECRERAADGRARKDPERMRRFIASIPKDDRD